MAKTAMEMVGEAKVVVPSISAESAMSLADQGNVVFLDVRDAPEVAKSGTVKDAIHISRGMLEFRADEAMPTHHKGLSKDKTIVIFCASGGRAALAGKVLVDLGYPDVRNMGGLESWTNAGGAVDKS